MGIQTRAVKGAYSVEYVLGGEQVSRLFVRDLRMRIGGAALRMGGIADVETKDEYRRRGYARQALARAVELMREHGYDISTLFGISDFYPRWGYVPIFPETRLMVALRDAMHAHLVYPVRRLQRHELPLTLELYQRNNAARTGAIVRQRDTWIGFRHGSRYRWPTNVYGAFDGQSAHRPAVGPPTGALMGYAVIDRSPAEAIVPEVGYRSEQVFSTLMAAAARQARRVHSEQIHILAPPDHPFAEYCKQLGCRLMIHYHRSGGAMGRIINIETCFERLTGGTPPAGELTRRLRASRLDWNGRLAIVSDIGEVTLRIEGGVVAAARDRNLRVPVPRARLSIPQGLLTQLLFGYRDAADVLRAKGVSLRHAPVELIQALFPCGYAYVWRPDYF